MATTADFRNGMCLDIDGQYYFIVEFLHVKPGKGPFMHPETFEQISIPEAVIDGVQFLKEGDTVEAMVHAASETVLTCELPAHVDLRVTYTEPGLKGDTATNTLKPATVETGAEVRVPLFISEGELITIDTRNGAYIGRVKEA